jgi:hypothetical protein
MRNFLIVSTLALVFGGCAYDPVAACENRCEGEKREGCRPTSDMCDNACVLADDLYDAELDRARERGCVGEYNNYVGCLDGVPICATPTQVAAMCAEEFIAYSSC